MKKYLLLILLSVPVSAVEVRFSSGLFKGSAIAENAAPKEAEEPAVEKFFKEKYGYLTPDTQWRAKRSLTDHTHIHKSYELYHLGRRVYDRSLKLNYNRKGWVQYARSNWSVPIKLADPVSKTETQKFAIAAKVQDEMTKKFKGGFEGIIKLEPVFWSKKADSALYPAYIVDARWDRHNFHEARVYRELNQEHLANIPTRDYLDNKAYKVSPMHGVPITITFSGLLGATELRSNELEVNRSETGGTLVDVDPTVDYSDDITTDPSNYDTDCTGGTSACPNQAFDAVGVYYHMTAFRTRVDSIFSELGYTPSWSLDPMTAKINLTGTSVGDSNNAYFDRTTSTFGFLPPAPENNAEGKPVKLYDLAREVLVIIHEYQHYVTYITAELPNSSSGRIGGAMNEGYSDYAGGAYVSDISGSDHAISGEYGFQNLPEYTRNFGILVPFNNTEEELEGHKSSPSWSSGLWRMRKEFGAHTTDLIAYKALLFMPADPSFSDAVESLVRADTELFSGSHVGRIRQLYYDHLRFYGGDRIALLDGENMIADLGFSSCSSVDMTQNRTGLPLLGALLVWLTALLAIGRTWLERR